MLGTNTSWREYQRAGFGVKPKVQGKSANNNKNRESSRICCVPEVCVMAYKEKEVNGARKNRS